MDFLLQQVVYLAGRGLGSQHGGQARGQLQQRFARGGQGVCGDGAHGLKADQGALHFFALEPGHARFFGLAQGAGDVVVGGHAVFVGIGQELGRGCGDDHLVAGAGRWRRAGGQGLHGF